MSVRLTWSYNSIPATLSEERVCLLFIILLNFRNRMRVCEALPHLKCLLLLFITRMNSSHPNIKNCAHNTTAFAWSSNGVRKSWRNFKRRKRTSNWSFRQKKKSSTRWSCCQSKLRLNWWEFLFRCQSLESEFAGLKAVDLDGNHGCYCSYCVRSGVCLGSVCFSVYDGVIASFRLVCFILLIWLWYDWHFPCAAIIRDCCILFYRDHNLLFDRVCCFSNLL